jgi:hypothetical protein
VRAPHPVLLALVVLLAGSGCLPMRQTPAEAVAPTAASEWPTVYSRAMTEASESRIGAADRTLADFAQHYPGSPEAAEVPYWRAVIKLDPSNATSLREAITSLESYLASAPAGTHRPEAGTFRRLGLALEQRNAAIAAMPTVAAVHPEDKAREEELQRLRDELSQANAELARIRRRLTRPRP